MAIDEAEVCNGCNRRVSNTLEMSVGPVHHVSSEMRRRSSPYARPQDRSFSIDVDASSNFDVDELPNDQPSCVTSRRTRSADWGGELGQLHFRRSSPASLGTIGLRRSGVSDLISELAMIPDISLAPLPLLRSEPLREDDTEPHLGAATDLSREAAAQSLVGADSEPLRESDRGSSTLMSPSYVHSPSCMPRSSTHSTHSKGEAIVQAALDRLEVGVHRDRGGLEVMEDEHSVVQRTSALALVGVYDGHCGREAAAYLRDHLLQSVEALLDEYSSKGADSYPLDSSSSSTRDEVAARHALISGFGMCEDALSRARTTAGATAVVLMLQSGGRALNVAWCGDCRAVLSRGGAAVVLTTDHTCQNEHERTRVRRAGAEISGGRLCGYLEVTRSFGGGLPAEHPAAAANLAVTSAVAAALDADPETLCDPGARRPRTESRSNTSVISSTLEDPFDADIAEETGAAEAAMSPCTAGWSKMAGLVAQPDVISEALRANDEFVILASDGLWNVLSPAEAVKAARSELRSYDDASMAAERLVHLGTYAPVEPHHHADRHVSPLPSTMLTALCLSLPWLTLERVPAPAAHPLVCAS